MISYTYTAVTASLQGGSAMAAKISIIAVFSLLVLALAVLKALKIGNRRRGVVKMLTSALFVGTGIYGCVICQGHLDIVLVVGLAFAFLGDLLLVFMDNHKLFVAGVLSFSAASITLSVYCALAYGFTYWAILPFVLFTVASAACQVAKVYSFGGDVVCLNVYTVCVSICGSLGIAVACVHGGVQAVLFGVGCFMYMCSDVCLGLYLLRFKRTWLDIVNTLLYFPGLLLVALSLVF